MPLTIISGPHQSGKSRRLWETLRAQAPGTAVLVRPGGLTRELVVQVHAWCGPGWMPVVVSLPELAERAAAALGDVPHVFSDSWVRHALRRWLPTGLAGSPWARLAAYRRMSLELADLLLRLDAQMIPDDELGLIIKRVHSQREAELAAKLRVVLRARQWLRDEGLRRGATTAGARWHHLRAAPLAWTVVAVDDVLAVTPAEAAWLADLAHHRHVIVTAIDDDRCPGGLLERMRSAAPGAHEERCDGLHPDAPFAQPTRLLLPALVPPAGEAPALPHAALGALDRYRYRDPGHAGRALAAWLTARQVPAEAVNVYLRTCDEQALALADALRAAGVPVRGRFHVAYGATAEGAAIAALGRYLDHPSWSTFRGVALRLQKSLQTHLQTHLQTKESAPATPLLELDGPWPSVEVAFTALAALAEHGEHDHLLVAAPLRPAMASTLSWLRALHALLPVAGSWFGKLTAAALALDLPLGPVGPALAVLDGLHPVAADDLIEALADASIEIERDDGPHSLAVLDAVRGRSQPRAVAVLHGLEHGRWPAQPMTGMLLNPEERAQLGGDWFDERGRTGGELAVLLACAARGLTRLVVGIPCGKRQPSAWLATLLEQAEQAGDPSWELEALRSAPDAEAVAGAPISLADSQGAHEQALWGQLAHQPSLRFQVPPCAPRDLGLKVSSLDLTLGDSFALVCQRLGLGGVLQDRTRMTDGNELHALLAQLVAFPSKQWPRALEQLLATWIDAAPDDLERAARRQRAPRLREVVTAESAAADQATVAVEQRLAVTLDLGALGRLTLNGRADRIDRHADGSVTVIDYKRGSAAAQRAKVDDQREAQVLAYVQALRAGGAQVREGVFVPLANGKRVAIELEQSALRWARVTAAVAALANGTAEALVDGKCPPSVIRAAEFVTEPAIES